MVLPDETKEAVAEALKALKKAATHWQQTLMVQIDGIGLYDESAEEAARRAYMNAVVEVTAIVSPNDLARLQHLDANAADRVRAERDAAAKKAGYNGAGAEPVGKQRWRARQGMTTRKR